MTIAWFILLALAIFGYPTSAVVATILGLEHTDVAGIGVRAAIAGIAVAILSKGLATGRILKTRVWGPLGLFWLLYVYRLFVDTSGTKAGLLVRAPYEYWLLALGSAALPMMALTISPDVRRLERGRSSLWLTIGAVSITATAILLSLQESTVERLSLSKLNPISFGHLAVTTGIVATSRVSGRQPRSFPLESALLLGVVAFAVMTVLMSGSRGPIIAFAASLLSAFAVRKQRLLLPTGRQVAAISIGIAAGLSLFGYAPGLIRDSTANRAEGLVYGDIYDPGQTAVSARLDLLSEAEAAISTGPLIGARIESASGRYPHNLVVESLMATGIIGGVAFCLSALAALIASMRLVRSGGEFVWLGLVHIQYLVGGMFSGALWGAGIYWSTLGAVLAVDAELKRFGRQRERAPAQPTIKRPRFY